MAAWKLYYDGGCNLCHTSQLKAERWAQRAGQPLGVDVLLSDEAISKGYGDAMVLEADGLVYTAAEAWLKILTISPWYFRWVSVFRLNPVSMRLAKWVYGIVAKYRYKWFGTRECRVKLHS